MYKKILTAVLKIAVSVGIVAYLVWDACRTKSDGSNVFQDLLHQPKDWPMLAAALGVLAFGMSLVFIRWWVLLRALDVPAGLGTTIRISFWGFLFNLAPLGVVGGDLVKAVMLARKQPGKQASVVAAVIVDRIIGLYILFVVATVAILVTGFWHWQVAYLDRICKGVFLVTGLGTVGIASVLILDNWTSYGILLLHRIPRVGRPVATMLEDIRLYRHRIPSLLVASLLTVGVHLSSSVSFYLIARGLPGTAPPLGIHFVIVPLAISSGVVPLPMGPLEAVLDYFYAHLPMCSGIAKGQGLLVALVNRLNAIIIALIGVLFVLGSRRDVAAAMHDTPANREGEVPAEPQWR